jgi:transcriptional regulator with XRE-family HTH domain
MMQGAAGPTVLRILLGAQMRRLRDERGVTAREAARAIGGSESKISRIELGRTSVREVDIADLLSLYGITNVAEREELLTLASQANQPGWWHRYQGVLPGWFQAYIGLEEAAESIRSYDALFGFDDFSLEESERLVLLLKERQRKLASGRLWMIVDEAALRRQVGSAEIMRAQLEHLEGICDLPGVRLQVVPQSAGAFVTPGSFSILSFAAPDLPDVVYTEQLTSALYLDKPADVDRYAAAVDKLSAVCAPAHETKRVIRALLQESDQGLCRSVPG